MRRRVRPQKNAPWFSGVAEEVRSLKQQRRRAERLWLKTGLTVHKQLYNNEKKKKKKLVTKLVHKAKTTYYCNKIKESLSCKQLFSVANQLVGNKKPSPLPTVFPLIDLPKRFLDFFKDKIETIRNKLDVLSSNPPACTEFSFHGRPLTHFRPVTEDFVRRTILSSPLKTCELDAFPTPLLLECLDSLLPCITAVFNNSLVSGVFPSVYKSALVKPLLKKMSLDPDDLKNYRPVSNLPFLSKVLERILLSQLNEHLNHNNLLSPLQSAYRPNHSTETTLLRIVNDLLTAMDSNKICILTLLDLSAAFDTTDHQILLTRLQHSFGISGPALSWFLSYICNRTHAVTINGLQSEHTTLHYGVPQGSVLGPVLVILYTQPLFNLVSKHAVNHHTFADDNQLYKISTLDAIHQSIETLQNCATDVKSWMTANKLQLNDNKTEAMIILSNRMSVYSPLPSVIHIGDADVPFVSSVKNLGVTLDSNLSMSQHIGNTCKAAYIQIRHISSIRHLLTTQATQTLVCSLVLSRLDFCNSLLPLRLPSVLTRQTSESSECSSKACV